VYINIYRSSREYGGPEEGGWYFTRYHPDRSYRIKDDTEGELLEAIADDMAYALEPPYVAIVEAHEAKYWHDYQPWD
jgi:hypothetical protein